MKTLLSMALGVVLLAAAAGPARAAATTLYMVNPTPEPAVFTVFIGDQINEFVLLPGTSMKATFAPGDDDRALIASKGGNGGMTFATPFQVYGTTSFNPAKWAFDTVGVTLVKDGNTYRLVYLLQDAQGEIKAVSEDELVKKLLKANEEAIKKATANPRKSDRRP